MKLDLRKYLKIAGVAFWFLLIIFLIIINLAIYRQKSVISNPKAAEILTTCGSSYPLCQGSCNIGYHCERVSMFYCGCKPGSPTGTPTPMYTPPPPTRTPTPMHSPSYTPPPTTRTPTPTWSYPTPTKSKIRITPI